MYGDVCCISVPDRPDSDKLPQDTWEDFRNKFMRGAMSRTAIFDYRHCIREFHAVLERVRNVAATAGSARAPSESDLDKAVKDAIQRIKDLAKKQVLVY